MEDNYDGLEAINELKSLSSIYDGGFSRPYDMPNKNKNDLDPNDIIDYVGNKLRYFFTKIIFIQIAIKRSRDRDSIYNRKKTKMS